MQDIPSGKILYKSLSRNGLYPIYSNSFQASSAAHVPYTSCHPQSFYPAFTIQKSNKWLLWHHRLGHPSDKILSSSLSSLVSNKTSFNRDVTKQNSIVSHCRHCLCGKMHHIPFKESTFQSSRPLELVHSDVWGPAPVTSINDYKYYVVFVDDFTKFT